MDILSSGPSWPSGDGELAAQIAAELHWDGKPFDAGNSYETIAYTYYVPFPTWWRRFAFRVLTPRDIAVYIYVCSYMNSRQLSWPIMEQISNDLGSSNRHGVAASLKRLDDLGFLLRQKFISPRGKQVQKYVYQRPMAAYTLARLLTRRQINGYLQPTDKTRRKLQERMPGRIEARLWDPLVRPLIEIIGRASFGEYRSKTTEPEMRKYLIQRLNEVVEAKRAEAVALAGRTT